MTLVRTDSGSSERSEQVLVAMGIQSGRHAVLPRTGLELPPGLTLSFEKWLRIGEVLAVVRTSSAWCLGDWLVYGEMAYSGRYRDAIKHSSLDYQTLRNYAWVARRFPLSRRRETLSFGHHAEVASLPEPEQDYWLRQAESLGWSTNRLRREVRASLNERAVSDGVDPKGAIAGELVKADVISSEVQLGEAARDDVARGADDADHHRLRLQLKVPITQFELCKMAAEKAGLSMEAWAVRTLCQAASQVTVLPG